MHFKEFRFIFISLDYLKKMHEVDSEVYYQNTTEYEKKPHLGILVTKGDREYVIPLTSAKKKHKEWKDVTAEYLRVYEVINMETAVVDAEDIIVDITNTNELYNMGISSSDYGKYKKRLLAVLDIRKMIPVKDGVYWYAALDVVPGLELKERQRRILMQKEYMFCKDRRDVIEKKAKKVFEKQMKTGKVLKYHCNFKILEKASDEYMV